MRHISVKIPTETYQELETIAKANDLKLSDIVRKCFKIGLKAFDLQTQGERQSQQDKTLHKEGLRYSIATYCLIDEYIKNISENANIQFIANTRAQEIVSEIYQKFIKKESPVVEHA